jgi:hypothetical protein
VAVKAGPCRRYPRPTGAASVGCQLSAEMRVNPNSKFQLSALVALPIAVLLQAWTTIRFSGRNSPLVGFQTAFAGLRTSSL